MAVHVTWGDADRPKITGQLAVEIALKAATVKRVKIDGDRLIVAFTNGGALHIYSPGIAYVEYHPK